MADYYLFVTPDGKITRTVRADEGEGEHIRISSGGATYTYNGTEYTMVIPAAIQENDNDVYEAVKIHRERQEKRERREIVVPLDEVTESILAVESEPVASSSRPTEVVISVPQDDLSVAVSQMREELKVMRHNGQQRDTQIRLNEHSGQHARHINRLDALEARMKALEETVGRIREVMVVQKEALLQLYNLSGGGVSSE